MARAVDSVDPRVGVARMNEDLLVLLEPAVDGVPVEGDVTLERSEIASGLGVIPRQVLLNPASGVGAPALGPSARTRSRILGREQVHAHVFDRKPVDGWSLCLEHEQNLLAVDQQLVVEISADAPRAQLDVHSILQARTFSSSRNTGDGFLTIAHACDNRRAGETLPSFTRN